MAENKLYLWGTDLPYNDYSSYIKRRFETRLQKISVDAGFTCPNRDGTKGRGGCTYCNNNTFKPFYTTPKKTVTQQLEEGIAFFAEKYKSQHYLAYFQSFSNTYANIDTLKKLYSEALSVAGVKGLVIATRPDCVDEAALNYLEELARTHYIVLEYGAESCLNKTLDRINRAHRMEDTREALLKSVGRGFDVGVHLILGLPGESREEILSHADCLSELPFDMLKLHQLQIIKGTRMARDYAQNPAGCDLFELDEYVDFVARFAERLNPEIKLERFVSEVPSDMLIAPRWGRVKNFEINHKVIKALRERGNWQGKYFKKNRADD